MVFYLGPTFPTGQSPVVQDFYTANPQNPDPVTEAVEEQVNQNENILFQGNNAQTEQMLFQEEINLQFNQINLNLVLPENVPELNAPFGQQNSAS